jgi:hypothetical protein
MGMKPGVISKSVDYHDHAHFGVGKSQDGAEEDLETFLGAMTRLRQEFTVVFEIDTEHDGDGEDKLPVRNGIQDVVGNVLPN